MKRRYMKIVYPANLLWMYVDSLELFLQNFRQNFLEAIHRLDGPALHARGDRAVSILYGREYGFLIEDRLAVLLFKGGYYQPHMAGQPLKFKSVDQPLGRGDLVIHAVERKLLSLGTALHIAPHTALLHLHPVHHSRIASRPPPFGDQRRVGVGGEHALAGRVEGACHDDFLFSGRYAELCLVHFDFSFGVGFASNSSSRSKLSSQCWR